MAICKIFELKKFQSEGTNLTPVELKDAVPFEVRRVYFIEMQPGSTTHQHCHKVEEEVFIQQQGKSTIVIDRGQGKEEIILEPNQAIYLPAFVWHGFINPSPNCLILALSSTNYSPDRSDYIENYDDYLKIRDENL